MQNMYRASALGVLFKNKVGLLYAFAPKNVQVAICHGILTNVIYLQI